MPKSPDSEGVPRLMTVTEIAEEHGVSRQTVHSYRTRGSFPKPVEGEGSTRPRFRADEVAAWFEANPPRPGKRTDLANPEEGDSMSTAEAAASTPEITTVSLRPGHWDVLRTNVLHAVWGEARKVGLSREDSNRIAEEGLAAVRRVVEMWAQAQAKASDG